MELGDNVSLSKEIEKLKFDKRLMDWNLKHGKLSKDDVKKHLATLLDCSANMEHLVLGDESGNGEYPDHNTHN